MDNPLQSLLDESDKTIRLQKEIIDNQKQQISRLTEANQLLEKENGELTQMYHELSADYTKAVAICREQQTVLDQFLDSYN